MTGCQPESVNLAAPLSFACDREREGHHPAVAAPAGPIRRERSWSCRRVRSAMCSPVAQISLWSLICSRQRLQQIASHCLRRFGCATVTFPMGRSLTTVFIC
ncbi:hypothetical protein GOODEAATRI_028666 [Goodea atripinnis]|uniref:Uncharacterized protein n=1 Tax=Goodea atripinnis TaxID=208336 RepID=A0ABV0NNY0_9TELE